ncbi:MAG TPA: AAC(3) family N-acetyltransferase [Trueperaceae bacterium]
MGSREHEVVGATRRPLTAESLALGLRNAGLESGQTVLVHSSLSSLGWVVGGPVAVIEALLIVLGPSGTLAMPSHNGENCDPSLWQNPPVPREWWQTIRESMPPFDPEKTPTRGVGVIAEAFRSWPGVKRSVHPTVSFAALGPRASLITANHDLEDALGDGSPLARLYDLDASVLLLGVGHASNTSLHLAEARARYRGKVWQETGSAVLRNGRREWVEYRPLDYDSDDFDALGSDFEAAGAVRVSKVGQAQLRLMSQRELVEFGVGWLEENRQA